MPIRKMREKARMTQGQLAAILGLERSTVSKWETRERYPRATMLPDIARVLGCSISDLYDDTVEGDDENEKGC